MRTSTNDHIEDKQLLANYYATHDNVWLGQLLERYTLMLYGVCMKYLKNEENARDGVQQVFEKVISELQKYKVDYFKSWVYMVAKNHCLMKLREKGIYFNEINENTLSVSHVDHGKAEAIKKDRELDEVAQALDQLNEEQKLCITSFYLQQKSYKDISEETGMDILKVKSHIQNGKRNLRIIIERNSSNE